MVFVWERVSLVNYQIGSVHHHMKEILIPTHATLHQVFQGNVCSWYLNLNLDPKKRLP